MKKSRTLIVSFSFPPYPRVGAKRWESFAKELHERGHDIHVFTAIPLSKYTSYQNDSYEFKVHRKPIKYPEVLINFPNDCIGRTAYRMWRVLLSIRFRGNIYDYSINWGDYFREEISRIIEEYRIQNVIVTGGPFRYFNFAINLKERFDLRIILDYRDPWTTKNRFDLSLKRNREEREMERRTVFAADSITTASRDVKASLETVFLADFPDITNRIYVIENGLDTTLPVNKISDKALLNDRNGKELNLVYYGGIHCNLKHFECFVEAVLSCNRIFDNLIKLTLYGNMNPNYNDIVRQKGGDHIQVEPRITDVEFLRIAEKTDFFVYLKPFGGFENSFGVKFFDYLRGRRKILLIAPKGDVVDFVENNEIGYVLPVDGMFEYLAELFEKRLKGEIIYESKPELESELSIKSRALEIERVLDL